MVAFSQLLFMNTNSYIRITDVTCTNDVPRIHNLNWCKAMVDNLRQSGRLYKMEKRKKLMLKKSGDGPSICSCTLFLVVSLFFSF